MTGYRAGTIERDRRTNARLEVIDEQIEALLPSDALAVAQAQEQSAKTYFDTLADLARGAS